MRRLPVILLVLTAACSMESGTPSETAGPPSTGGDAPAVTGPVETAPAEVTGGDPPTTTTTIATSTTTHPTAATTEVTTTTLPALEGLGYREVATGLAFPTVMVPRPGEPDPVVGTKAGEVGRLLDGALEPILDLSDSVADDGERGLLGLAFHPDDGDRMFVHHSDRRGDTVVAEYALSGWAADPESERVLFTVDQPASNHNGGMIQFGPDGMLYLGLGDGGGAADQFGHGRRDDTPLAGLVRIDVDSGEAGKFAGGLRNPWRFWIDGDRVFVADVGQGSYEEVTVAPLEPGVDYGWPITEGLHCFAPPSGCETGGLTLPVLEVAHGDAGTCSITGGVVYRGPSIPEVEGQFFFSDFCGGYLRSVTAEGDVTDWTGQVGVPGSVVSFGLDGAGEMHVLTTDTILEIVPVR